MEHLVTVPPAAVVLITILFCVWYVVRDTKRAQHEDDSDLLDFLDQSGFSVQHLNNGLWGITDGAQRLVGKPARDVRDAIRSAVDQLVEDRRG